MANTTAHMHAAINLSAIGNNADWYEEECQAWGIAYTRTPDAWLSHGVMPPYHSNLLLFTDTDLSATLKELAELKQDQHWSVKDAQAVHDLSAYGLEILFEAKWYFRPAQANPDENVAEVQSPAEFQTWIQDWGETPTDAQVFHPELWRRPNVGFLHGGTGGIAYNISHDCIGLSNFWGEQAAITACINHVSHRNLPLVGYERDETAHLLRDAGFVATGPLRIWVSEV